MGIAVFAGMIGVTLFGLFLTPVFMYADEARIQETHCTARNRKNPLSVRLERRSAITAVALLFSSTQRGCSRRPGLQRPTIRSAKQRHSRNRAAAVPAEPRGDFPIPAQVQCVS